jgi:hypothetical protein
MYSSARPNAGLTAREAARPRLLDRDAPVATSKIFDGELSMALQISVSPVGDGWAVRSEAFDNAIIYPSGGKAEASARSLAQRYAQAGQEAEVRVYLRDGALAGRFLHHAAA